MDERSLPYLLQVRDAVLTAAQEILDSALSEGRALRADELARVAAIREQAEELSQQISARREANRRELSLPQRY